MKKENKKKKQQKKNKSKSDNSLEKKSENSNTPQLEEIKQNVQVNNEIDLNSEIGKLIHKMADSCKTNVENESKRKFDTWNPKKYTNHITEENNYFIKVKNFQKIIFHILVVFLFLMWPFYIILHSNKNIFFKERIL